VSALLGVWQRPHDLAAWAGLGVALYFAMRALPAEGTSKPVSRLRFLTLAGFAAAFLSLAYIAYYLRGGPRIIDATSYFLQGRALSHGMLSWSIPEVSANFRGRFLLFHEPDRLAGIFPPGYPLLLALGFLVGAPMVIGPLLAAGLVIATYFLARELVRGHAEEETIARFAAALSVVSVALRYHTADTMAHGAAALAVTIGFCAALAARRKGDLRLFALAGLALGYVVCTRPISALPIGGIVLALAFGAGRRALGVVAAAAVPGVLLLLAANRAATGSLFGAPQLLYYTTSDGPPGCFRYGFGAHVGCLFEHKDFVAARLPHGYGLVEAIGVTARRLRMHLTDFANLEPLFLLVPLAARTQTRTRPAVLALTLVVGQVVAYAPFYFDGNYPGGGARLLAEVLPTEHALAALALATILPKLAYARRAFGVLTLAALGFAVHGSNDHRALAERDGGRPMFEPDRLREANVQHGLVFFETDHGFNLAFEPGILPSHGIVAARFRGDDHDRLLHARLGHPIAHVYHFRTEPGAEPEVSKFQIQGGLADPAWRFESEADWPPLAQAGGYAEPVWATTTCASAGRVLTVRTTEPNVRASVTIELPVPRAATWRIRPNVLLRGTGAETELALGAPDQKEPLRWTFRDPPGTPHCETLPPQTVELAPPAALLTISTNREISLDYVTIEVENAPH
jgi:hypothetical protein